MTVTAPLRKIDFLLLGLIGLWTVAWLAPDLGHPSIHNWDESFHQAVTRGTLERFPVPTMYVDPFDPLVLRQWWHSGVWMHKAPAVFWWGAVMLKVLGITTAALRSASLLAEIALAAMIFLLIRPIAGRPLAFVAALSFALQPFGYFMTQGHFVSDVTDISVAAFVTAAMLFLWRAHERESVPWAALSGAMLGLGYLTKTFLVLGPLGVAGVWWALGVAGYCKGPRLSQLFAMVGTFVVVAAPWNVIAYVNWKDVYLRAFDHTIGFVNASSGEDVGSGARPPDAIFHELNAGVLKPFPYPFTFLAGAWLAIRAIRDRDPVIVAIALWLWSSWVVHSYANVKGHGHMWNVSPAVFVAYAVIVHDLWRRPVLAATVAASLAIYTWPPFVRPLVAFRLGLPWPLVQTARWSESNTVEQLAFVTPIVIAFALLARAWRDRPVRHQALGLVTAFVATAGVFAYAVPISIRGIRAEAEALDHDHAWSSTEDVGLALSGKLPEKSVFFMDTNHDYKNQFEYLNLMFWSGRMTYRRVPDLAKAAEKGYHPYLVTPEAASYEPLPVPAHASLRAYDLSKPTPAPAPLPEGLTPLPLDLTTVKSFGWAARQVNGRWSRYAFYLAPKGIPTSVTATWHLNDGTTVEQTLEMASTLRAANVLGLQGWFVLPAVGPVHTKVTSLSLRQ